VKPLAEDSVEQLIKMVGNLEELDDIREIIQLVS